MFFKIGLLKNFANFTENTCVGVYFSSICRPEACNFINRRPYHRSFPVKFSKFLRTPFLQNTSDSNFWKHCVNKLQGRLNFSLVARCLLLFARCLLLFVRCSLRLGCCSLLFARCSLLFARYSLLFARYSLLFACCLLLPARCS